jgi:ribonuclease-3
VLEWGQKNKKAVVFKVTSSTGQDHNKQYKVALLLDDELVSEGSGTSIKRAEEQAAEQVKKRLFIE